MKQYKQEFAHFLVEAEALQFGDFTLKSGKQSPYFFNSACFNQSSFLKRLGMFYAQAMTEYFPNCELIFGPAYKGIPLAISTAMQLESLKHEPVKYCFNRKEAKPHGDQGLFVGFTPQNEEKLVIVDDVMTNGATKTETIELIQCTLNAKILGVLVALDRMEINAEGIQFSVAFEQATQTPVYSILTIKEALKILTNHKINGKVYLTQDKSDQIFQYLSHQ